MHTCRRNRVPLSYALYAGKVPVYDAYGLKTGEYTESYTDPVTVKMCVAPAVGRANLQPYGIKSDYTHIAVTDDMSCPINESSVVWIGASTSTPANARVVTVAKGLDSIMYALKVVDV